ncbi:Abi family protein [Aliarcobacter thereius]|uniref:Abi family protein n=1 Tax=Aliarcobacter thereius TaxID=544718 RepID=UPI0008291C18|nr:Abi family protein [Aliarcobacter thereius]OCL91223.1 Abi-like protein [Aliarcobacter thereius]
MYSLYTKPYKNSTDLIKKLKSQNLKIVNEQFAEKILSKINYFRFKIYLKPFLETTTKQFKANSTFENAYELYSFDEDLKSILFSIIGQIEINLRTKLDQYITSHTNNSFWYLDNKYFINESKIFNTKVSLKNEFLRSKDDFTLHYKENYVNNICNDFKEMPPFWIISELSTFGNILSFFETIDKKPFTLVHNKNVLDELSKDFGAKNLKELNSWLKLIRDVRNRVAHHSRVWNCNYREPYGIRQNLSSDLNPTQTNKIYLFFVILEILYKNQIVDKNIQQEIKILLNNYPKTRDFIDSMGIPQKWLD